MSEVLTHDLYLHLPSLDVKKSIIHHNSTLHFTVELPSMLFLYGVWEMSVLMFSCKFTNGIKYRDSLQIVCDVIDLSPLKSSWEPLLRSILFDRAVRTPDVLLDFRYVKVAHSSIKRIDLKLQLHSSMELFQLSLSYI